MHIMFTLLYIHDITLVVYTYYNKFYNIILIYMFYVYCKHFIYTVYIHIYRWRCGRKIRPDLLNIYY